MDNSWKVLVLVLIFIILSVQTYFQCCLIKSTYLSFLFGQNQLFSTNLLSNSTYLAFLSHQNHLIYHSCFTKVSIFNILIALTQIIYGCYLRITYSVYSISILQPGPWRAWSGPGLSYYRAPN